MEGDNNASGCRQRLEEAMGLDRTVYQMLRQIKEVRRCKSYRTASKSGRLTHTVEDECRAMAGYFSDLFNFSTIANFFESVF